MQIWIYSNVPIYGCSSRRTSPQHTRFLVWKVGYVMRESPLRWCNGWHMMVNVVSHTNVYCVHEGSLAPLLRLFYHRPLTWDIQLLMTQRSKMIQTRNFHQSTSVNKLQNTLEAHGYIVLIFMFSIVPHTIDIITFNVTYLVRDKNHFYYNMAWETGITAKITYLLRDRN